MLCVLENNSQKNTFVLEKCKVRAMQTSSDILFLLFFTHIRRAWAADYDALLFIRFWIRLLVRNREILGEPRFSRNPRFFMKYAKTSLLFFSKLCENMIFRFSIENWFQQLFEISISSKNRHMATVLVPCSRVLRGWSSKPELFFQRTDRARFSIPFKP